MNMSNELVTLQDNSFIDTGLDAIAPLKPSFLRFLQPSTGNLHGGEPGQFYDETTGDLYDSLTVVPLKVMQNRVMYPPGADIRSGVKPICRSDDGVIPSRYIEHPQARACAGCKYAEWNGGKPSECSANLKMLVILKDTGVPRFVVASGTSISPLRQMLRRINEDIQVKRLKGEPVALYDYFFTINTEKKRNYFMMKFSEVQRVTELGEFGILYQKFVATVNQPQSAAETADEAVDAEIINI